MTPIAIVMEALGTAAGQAATTVMEAEDGAGMMVEVAALTVVVEEEVMVVVVGDELSLRAKIFLRPIDR
jgi:hypothetical protein